MYLYDCIVTCRTVRPSFLTQSHRVFFWNKQRLWANPRYPSNGAWENIKRDFCHRYTRGPSSSSDAGIDRQGDPAVAMSFRNHGTSVLVEVSGGCSLTQSEVISHNAIQESVWNSGTHTTKSGTWFFLGHGQTGPKTVPFHVSFCWISFRAFLITRSPAVAAQLSCFSLRSTYSQVNRLIKCWLIGNRIHYQIHIGDIGRIFQEKHIQILYQNVPKTILGFHIHVHWLTAPQRNVVFLRHVWKKLPCWLFTPEQSRTLKRVGWFYCIWFKPAIFIYFLSTSMPPWIFHQQELSNFWSFGGS